MSNDKENIDLLFENSNNFVLIGITGYTGSGCKTLANIFRSKYPPSRDLNQAIYVKDYFDNRKFEISKDFLNRKGEHDWIPFNTIKVGHIILMLISYISEKDIDKIVDEGISCGLVSDEGRSSIKVKVKKIQG